ncbi:MAG TPA: GMC family oxidoreductase N-terminal domain-containing protein [Candidatus Binataceae bacterium]|nr:GMC family oxidoreductase N-terminal domain-containing protein [Candidatus Binataceae bacterium]
MIDEFDYVIVGAGSAGCVLAGRLSVDPAVTVLLVEAGPPDTHPLIAMPMGIGRTLQDPSLLWVYQTEPEPAHGNRPYVWIRGKMLGGSSSVNGMLYFRGQPQDYDGWAAAGCPEWSWAQMSRCFREIEDHELGDDGIRGVGGPLHISVQREHTPLTEAIIEAGTALGLTRKEDLNRPEQEGVGYSPRTIRRGRRVSAADAFLKPARHRANLQVRTGLLATKILFEQRRATGVRVRSASEAPGVGAPGVETHTVRARREVILAAGTLQSPLLLQASGVGPGAQLQGLGIAVVHDNPNVGENLREHKTVSWQLRLKQPYSLNRELRGWRLKWNALRYFLTQTGPLAATYDINAFIRTRPELDRPDAQLTFWALSTKPGTLEPQAFPGLMLMGYPLRTESRGHVQLSTPDAAAPPLIKANFLATDYDRRTIVDLYRYARRWLARAELDSYLDGFTRPAQPVETDEEIIAYCLACETCLHAVGTCAMGAGEDAVVDGRLRVRGVERLRVMDLSVLPTQVSGNTNGAAMAMAWRAAEIILQDRGS